MAGHSKFKKIKHKKAAQDGKRAKLFTKAIRIIQSAIKFGGNDPETNFKLRCAIASAKAFNLPKERISNMLSSKTSGEDYFEIRYEGYAPYGVAIIVETLTNNRNRTASDIRSAFTKFGGNLGEIGSVSHGFEKVGVVVYEKKSINFDDVAIEAANCNAKDLLEYEDEYEIITEWDEVNKTVIELEKKFGEPLSWKIEWRPTFTVEISEEEAESVIKLIDLLEDSDDVQDVYHNFNTKE